MYLVLAVLCSCVLFMCDGNDNFTNNYDYSRSGTRRWYSNDQKLINKQKKTNNAFRSTPYPRTLENPREREEDTESSQFNSDALKSFLETYAKRLRKPSHSNENYNENSYAEESQDLDNGQQTSDKSKSWDLVTKRKNNSPHDHKTGWVTLEAVPWSVSKVSKWEGKPNNKPHQSGYENTKISSRPQGFPSHDDDRFERPETSYRPRPSYNLHKPNYNEFPSEENDQQVGYRRRPSLPNFSQSPFNKYTHESFSHNSEVTNDYDQRPPVRKYTTQKPYRNRYDNYQNGGSSHIMDEDIITDGKPANFPSYNDYYNRRVSVSMDDHPATYPENGNGEWILLTTSKGYKYPKHRQRSLQMPKNTIGVHRSVRLTVLPPLEDSKVNMTTSHGGLLQVESTFQSVEEAQKQYAEGEKAKWRKATTLSPPTTQKQWRIWRKKFQPSSTSSIKTINSNEENNNSKTATIAASHPASSDSTAVMAAVGAGMIPATMAMLVPMAMSGRKRRSTTKFIRHLPVLKQ